MPLQYVCIPDTLLLMKHHDMSHCHPTCQSLHLSCCVVHYLSQPFCIAFLPLAKIGTPMNMGISKKIVSEWKCAVRIVGPGMPCMDVFSILINRPNHCFSHLERPLMWINARNPGESQCFQCSDQLMEKHHDEPTLLTIIDIGATTVVNHIIWPPSHHQLTISHQSWS